MVMECYFNIYIRLHARVCVSAHMRARMHKHTHHRVLSPSTRPQRRCYVSCSPPLTAELGCWCNWEESWEVMEGKWRDQRCIRLCNCPYSPLKWKNRVLISPPRPFIKDHGPSALEHKLCKRQKVYYNPVFGSHSNHFKIKLDMPNSPSTAQFFIFVCCHSSVSDCAQKSDLHHQSEEEYESCRPNST